MIQDVNLAAFSAAQSALNFCSLLNRYTRCVTATRTSSRLPSPADAATAAVRLEMAGDRKIIRVEKSRRSVGDRVHYRFPGVGYCRHWAGQTLGLRCYYYRNF